MSKTFCFGLVALPLLFCLFSDSMMAQATVPQDPAPAPSTQQPAPATPAPAQPSQGPAAPQGAGIPPTMTVAPSTPPPPKEPYVLPDGGFYIEPLYWIDNGAPRLRGGLKAPNIADLQFNGKPKESFGVEIGIPAGRSNTLRVSALRVQGNAGFTIPKDAVVFGEQYLAGYFLNATYKIQAIKVSWDYLSYTWHKPSGAIRLKTLYEAQYITSKFFTAPPFVPGTSDASGNGNLASGSKSVVMPTLGMALAGEFGKYFRWDMRGSGMGLPGRSAIGDLNASVAVRVSKVELVVGERFLYFKTSPRADMYATDRLQGVYGGIRFVWAGVTK